MVRSLWTGATGMIAQQLNVDNISNNLANVNTTGYKSEVMEFKSLLYQTIQTRSTTANMEQKPIGAEVGLGVRNSAITSIFTQGSLLETPGEANFAIAGKGFFAVQGADGESVYYTRNGNMEFAIGSEDEDVVVSKISVTKDGTLMYPDDDGVPQSLDMQIGLWQFNNPGGLSKEGDSLFSETDASGEALNENDEEDLPKSKINLIVAQRAYEMNSKVITTSDEMLQQANQLKR